MDAGRDGLYNDSPAERTNVMKTREWQSSASRLEEGIESLGVAIVITTVYYR